MKNLLDLPIVNVINGLYQLKVREPITVKQGLHYLMFMQAISEDLQKVGGNSMQLSMERIYNLALEHGGYEPIDWQGLQGQAMMNAMATNGQQEVLFERLAHYTANLLA